MVYTSKESKPAKPTERVTLWGPDGKARTYNTLDAKEIMADPNTLYSRVPVAPVSEAAIVAHKLMAEPVKVEEPIKLEEEPKPEEAVVEAPQKRSKKDE